MEWSIAERTIRERYCRAKGFPITDEYLARVQSSIVHTGMIEYQNVQRALDGLRNELERWERDNEHAA